MHILKEVKSASGFPIGIDSSLNPETSLDIVFLCHLVVPMVGFLEKEGIALSINDIVADAGFVIYQNYKDEDAAKKISDGMKQYKIIVNAGSVRKNITDYIETINETIYLYVITGEKKLFNAFSQLYMTLFNAQEDLYG